MANCYSTVVCIRICLKPCISPFWLDLHWCSQHKDQACAVHFRLKSSAPFLCFRFGEISTFPRLNRLPITLTWSTRVHLQGSAAQLETYGLGKGEKMNSKEPNVRRALQGWADLQTYACTGNPYAHTRTHARTHANTCKRTHTHSRQPFAQKVVLHWSTCNANLQRRLATHVSRTNLQTCYTFESLSKTCNTLQHCKYREKSFATSRYTGMIFRATSYHCKLALQVDQCNTALRGWQNEDTLWRQHCWRDHVSHMCPRFATRATFVSDTILCPGHKKCFWKSSETFLVSARRATMLPRFATDGQHCRTQSCRHNVSSFCQGLKPLSNRCNMLAEHCCTQHVAFVRPPCGVRVSLKSSFSLTSSNIMQ